MTEAAPEQATPETEAPEEATPETEASDGTEALGDAGKQAIDRMKAERNDARRELATAREELENLRKASLSDQERAVEEARKAGETEATQRANDRLIRAEAKVLAATAKFRDPSDVIAQLGDKLSGIKVDDDGEIDQTALKALVDDLAKAKPYLLNTDNGTPSASDAGIGTTGSNGRVEAQPGLDRLRVAYASSANK